MAKQKESKRLIQFSHGPSTQLLLSESYKSHNSPRAWVCPCWRRPGPATPDVGDERPSDWRRPCDRRGGLSRTPDQPQRSFPPCGNQRGTPTKKQEANNRERGEPSRCQIPTLHQNWLPDLTKTDVRQPHTDEHGWTRKWSSKRLKLSVHKSWLI